MTTWWNSLSSLQQVLFVVAVTTTLIMLVQVLLMFIGNDDPSFDGGGFDADAGVDGVDTFNDAGFGSLFGLRILTVRSALAFFSIGSWVAYIFCEILPNAVWAAIILGVVAGVAAAFLIAYLMKLLDKLQSSGNIDSNNAVGKTADVYLTVPAARSGFGKVNVHVQERLVEFDAVTDDAGAIKTGSVVTVTGLIKEGTLLVSKDTGVKTSEEKQENN